MSPSIRRKLEALAERKVEVERLLAEPEVLSNQKRFRELSREYAQLEPIADGLAALAANTRAIDAAKQMQSEDDADGALRVAGQVAADAVELGIL